jgi:hypothetical protein
LKCLNLSSLWLEFRSLNDRRFYYRCAACGYMSEVDHDPVISGDTGGTAQNGPKRPPPWWAA